jgi:signal transduction histidine kinase
MDNDHWRFMHDQGLAFFGRIAASVSHEIKNHLAVINEQSGLISDLLRMSENQGPPPASQRLYSLSLNIAEQIRKADLTVRTFGRFSHSVDQHSCPVDLCELVEIMAGVAGRLASAKGVSLGWSSASCPLDVITSPFLLEQLVFHCLEHVLAATEPGGELTLTVSAALDKAAIELRHSCKGLAPLTDSPGLRLLKEELHAEVLSCGKESALRITVPAVLPGRQAQAEQDRE